MKAYNKDNALLVAAILFAIVALAHGIRILTHFNLIIARQIIPVWVSIPCFGVFLLLTVWMLMARKAKKAK